MDAKLAEERGEFVKRFRGKIVEEGYDVASIAKSLAGRVKRVPQRTYKTLVDPKNTEHTYVRGVLPGWIKEQMRTLGLDPASKADREKFKAEHMVEK